MLLHAPLAQVGIRQCSLLLGVHSRKGCTPCDMLIPFLWTCCGSSEAVVRVGASGADVPTDAENGQYLQDKDNREQQEQEIEDKAASSGTVEITSTPDKTEVNIGDRRHNNHGKRSSPEVDAEAYAARIPSAGTSNTANGAKGKLCT